MCEKKFQPPSPHRFPPLGHFSESAIDNEIILTEYSLPTWFEWMVMKQKDMLRGRNNTESHQRAYATLFCFECANAI